VDLLYRIEWEAYDDHSGLDSVYWKIYDNYGNYIEHGHEDIVAQGHAAVSFIYKPYIHRERRGRDHMVVGFTTCTISAYSH
jgi:hypothetical protein